MANQKRSSRRDFLKDAAVAATGVAASTALSGCTSSEKCNCGDEGTPSTGEAGTKGCPTSESGAGGTQTAGAGGMHTTGGGGGAAAGGNPPGTEPGAGGARAVGAGGTGTPGSDPGHTGGTSNPQGTTGDPSCPAPTVCATSATLPSQWAKEADVVVFGTGFAGLAAAIGASDAGAKVLVLEKMQKSGEGGNSIISGNMWWTPNSLDDGVKYMKALCMGLTDEKCIQALAKEMSTLNDWLKTVGVVASTLGVFQPEYPELPASGSVRTWRNKSGTLWQPLRDAVSSRNVEVLYETPAVDLIQDPSTREVKGVVAKSGNQNINIKAKKAVIMACGGFEFDYEMQAQYLPGWPVYCQGSPGNTGDGIKMAQKAGAGLWHMNNALAHVGCFVSDPTDPKTIPVPISLLDGCILVDKFGSRFMDEQRAERHGFGHKEFLFFFDGLKQSFSRIPCYCVFDEAGRKQGPLAGGLLGWYGKLKTYTWSADNSTEISKGWIKQGQTLKALATAIGVDGTALNDTVTKYNGFCTDRSDQDFGRSSDSLKALTTAPYYAMPIYPLMYNTQGGPRRNEKCQVVDPFGQPIPRLYSAGELGSFWGWMYNGGGNASECVITGRVAGENAAGEGRWA